MGKVTGFLEYQRKTSPYRDASQRLLDYREIYKEQQDDHLLQQSARCMDCGVPFCQSTYGCPIDNLIPEWNDLIYQGLWKEALDRLEKTNNFPEFTGRVCPAPCEGACVLGNMDSKNAVTIKNIEQAIADKGFVQQWIQARPPQKRSGKTVAIIGSGPAGLAAAAQLNQAGHWVKVYERADRIGGLLMYGIPNMKLDKQTVLGRRIQLMEEEGIEFFPNSDIGKDLAFDQLVAHHDAVIVATGSTKPRDLPVPGRDLLGIHFAMEFLTANTKQVVNTALAPGEFIDAKDKHVVVIGGGDTGTDCIATALRHGCRSLVNFEIIDQPGEDRSANNPWPQWPKIHRVDYGHSEAMVKFNEEPRQYRIKTTGFTGKSGKITAVNTVEVEFKDGQFVDVPGTQKSWHADLVLIAMGFVGPEDDWIKASQIPTTGSNMLSFNADTTDYQTPREKVFAAGDCRRGQSLVVWAIHEGRKAARSVDLFLMGHTELP